jgi:carbon storage regulator CsrA
MSRLVLSRFEGESIIIWTDKVAIEVKVVSNRGRAVRLLTEAPRHVHVDRKEIYEGKLRGDPPPAVKTRAAS